MLGRVHREVEGHPVLKQSGPEAFREGVGDPVYYMKALGTGQRGHGIRP